MKLACAVAFGFLLISVVIFPGVRTYAVSCSPAGTTGLDALIVVSTNGATLDPVTLGYSTVNAAGCDVGIYVAPGTSGVTISGLTITGANDHGIFVQDASSITITGNTVYGNGVTATGLCSPPTVVTNCIFEDKALQLVGTSNSLVSGNFVRQNLKDGGISVTDDGAVDPGAPNAGNANPGNDNTISNNEVFDNIGGCGIVVAAYDAGEGVSGNIIEDNTVSGGFISGNPYVGGIVVAADEPSTTVTNNQVIDNKVNGSLIPGIIVHANTPGDSVSGTLISGNTLQNNGFMGGNDAPQPAGINIVAEIPGLTSITSTTVTSNTVLNDYYGVWYCNTSPSVSGTSGNPTVYIASCAQPTGVPEFPLSAIGFSLVMAIGLVMIALMRKMSLPFRQPIA
ncbi:MAG: right-handed parallel beta-helix repeat-containing protein [Nitrososphaerota archaeon]|nr:right-handed parallel beta-helix repeat-containing protein [Nitrososphaerota archaeon]